MKKIIIDDAVPYAQAIFGHLGDIHTLPGQDITAAVVKDADALIIRSRTKINADLLEGSRVSFVGSTVVGLDHVDQNYLQSHNIHFYSAQGCNANSVSEYVICCLLSLAEQQNFQLSDRSIGIIGVGHVGKLLEQKAKALGMTVLLNDPPRAEAEGPSQFSSLDKTLACDIVSFHTPLTNTGKHPTHHLLNKHNFHHISPNCILINAARGGIIDESAWCHYKTKANIIDCWENEPSINSELYFKADLATPHIAGHAHEAKVKGSSMVYQSLCDFWGVKTQQDWKSQVPQPQETLKADDALPFQSRLHRILEQCYRPIEDDLAIRSNSINDVHKKFEYYRRHYPIHHEWTQYTVATTGRQNFDKTLQEIGFQTTIV